MSVHDSLNGYVKKNVVAIFQNDNFVHIINGEFQNISDGDYIFKNGVYSLRNNNTIKTDGSNDLEPYREGFKELAINCHNSKLVAMMLK